MERGEDRVSQLNEGLLVVMPLQVSELRFGPQQSGALAVDCSVTWRNMTAGGPGINTNYLMDISPEWRNPGGPTFQQALQARTRPSTCLNFPGCLL